MPLLLTFDFPPDRGGIQLYALRLSQGLQALGHATTVIAPTGRLRLVAAAAAFARHRFANADGQTIALSWRPALAAAIVPRRWRGTLTVLVHGTELDVRPGSLHDRAMRFVFARARHVIANSEFVARRVRALGLTSTPVVVWPGVDARTIPRRPAAKPTIVFVGRLIARKGIDALIEALALLSRRDIVLHIVGDGPQRAALESLARARGVSERVIFSGSVDDETRDRALSEAWCFAMPSRAEGGDVEGFGIALSRGRNGGIARDRRRGQRRGRSDRARRNRIARRRSRRIGRRGCDRRTRRRPAAAPKRWAPPAAGVRWSDLLGRSTRVRSHGNSRWRRRADARRVRRSGRRYGRRRGAQPRDPFGRAAGRRRTACGALRRRRVRRELARRRNSGARRRSAGRTQGDAARPAGPRRRRSSACGKCDRARPA